MDQNIYEGDAWSSLLPLTAHSIAQGGMPVEFPDFTEVYKRQRRERAERSLPA